MSPLRKGSRCHAPALCLSQWREWVYATFHLWDKENHRSSCNGGIFRVFRAGGFDEINRRWRNFNYSNREVLDLPVGGRKKKKTLRYLPSYLPEMTRKKNVFCDKKWPLWHGKWLKKLNFEQKHFWWKFNKMCTQWSWKNKINRKSREPFFKYGSLRLNDLRWQLKHSYDVRLSTKLTSHAGPAPRQPEILGQNGPCLWQFQHQRLTFQWCMKSFTANEGDANILARLSF